jgi:AcrR family transcriptional regulator
MRRKPPFIGAADGDSLCEASFLVKLGDNEMVKAIPGQEAMKQEKRGALRQLEPEGLAPEGPKWQQRKSSQTRTAILEAAIDCLEKNGYAQTTMQTIAEAARISRGAMTHHYASKQELISAVTDYLFYKRMEILVKGITGLTDTQRVKENLGVEVVWENYFTQEYRAHLELMVAARTDAELQRIFLPKAQRYGEIWRQELLNVFPEWREKLDILQHASDLIEASLQGMVLNSPVWNNPTREATVRAIVAMVVRMFRDGELSLPSKQAVNKFRPRARRK